MNAKQPVVLFYGPSLTPGGMATAFCSLASALEQDGWVVKVMVPYRADVENVAIPKKYIVGYAWSRPIMNRILVRMINIFNILTNWSFYFIFVTKIEHDVFVSYQGATTHYWGRYSSRPSVCYFHSMPFRRFSAGLFGKLRQIMYRNSYSKYTRIVAVSQQVAEGWKQCLQLDEEISVLHNVINVKNIKVISPLPCRDENIPLIVCASRLSKEKGVDRLLSVIDRIVNEKGKFIEAWIIGDGDQRCELEKFVTDHNLSRWVKFWGYCANPYAQIKVSDLLVCPSHSEGFGLVLIESLLLGTYVLSTRCGGVEDALGDGSFGDLVANSEDGLYEGICNWLNRRADEHAPRISEIQKEIFNRCIKWENEMRIFFDSLLDGVVKVGE